MVGPIAGDAQRGVEGLGRVAAERCAIAAALDVERDGGFDADPVARADHRAELGAVVGAIERPVDDAALFGGDRMEAVGVLSEEVGLQGEASALHGAG